MNQACDSPVLARTATLTYCARFSTDTPARGLLAEEDMAAIKPFRDNADQLDGVLGPYMRTFRRKLDDVACEEALATLRAVMPHMPEPP